MSATTGRSPAAALWSALRPHQWSKNLLVFLPLLLAHQWRDRTAVLAALVAFVAFSLTASAVYLVNDVMDLAHDRAHPTKRFRAVAAGHLRPKSATLAALILLVVAFALTWLIPHEFEAWLLVYVAAASAYTLWVKQITVLDVMVLAGLYVIRIAAGSGATGVPVSPWLLAFAMFFFLGLAFVKRTSELVNAAVPGLEPVGGRAYAVADLDAITALGAGASNVAVLVLVLYIQNPDTLRLYASPAWLWGVSATLLYWQGRLWLLARRGRVSEDPVVFALGDLTSWLCAVCVAVLVLVAI